VREQVVVSLFVPFIIFLLGCENGSSQIHTDGTADSDGVAPTDSDQTTTGDADDTPTNDAPLNDTTTDTDTTVENDVVPDQDQDIPLSCGNDTIDSGEVCDGGLISCTVLDEALYKAGKATCKTDCSGWDTATCEKKPACGNGEIEEGEVCEESNLKDCILIDSDLYRGGKAYCSDDCTAWDTSTCDTAVDSDNRDNDTPDVVQPDADTDTAACDNPNVGKNCKTDTECGTCLICVNAKCTAGCQSDADCMNYAGTKCNTKLSRCVNTTASSGACNQSNCPSGCCYATKGFQSVKCLMTAALATCGICKQGEIYMDGKQCVPAACSTGDTKCQTYNTAAPDPECYECKAGELVCYDDPDCSSSTLRLLSGYPVNSFACVAAGNSCGPNDSCCSGQPCIQGYCY